MGKCCRKCSVLSRKGRRRLQNRAAATPGRRQDVGQALRRCSALHRLRGFSPLSLSTVTRECPGLSRPLCQEALVASEPTDHHPLLYPIAFQSVSPHSSPCACVRACVRFPPGQSPPSVLLGHRCASQFQPSVLTQSSQSYQLNQIKGKNYSVAFKKLLICIQKTRLLRSQGSFYNMIMLKQQLHGIN